MAQTGFIITREKQILSSKRQQVGVTLSLFEALSRLQHCILKKKKEKIRLSKLSLLLQRTIL